MKTICIYKLKKSFLSIKADNKNKEFESYRGLSNRAQNEADFQTL